MSTSNAMQRKVPAAHRGLMDAMLFSRLEEKLQRQKKDLQAGSCEFQEIEKGINTLTHKIKGECVDLVQGISGLHAQIMQLSDTNRKYRDELSQLATIVAEKDQIISSLKNDLQSLSETHQHCEEDSNSLLSRLQTLENVLQSEIRKHKDYVSQAEALEDKWRFADAELEKAQKDARNAQSIVEQLRAEIMHQDSLLQIKDKAIQMGLQEINERALEIEKLQQSNHALQSDLAIVSNERIYLSEQKQKLSEELSATKARIQELLVESESNLRLEVDMHKSTKGMYEKACTEIKELMESNRKTAQEYDLLVRNHEDLRRQYSSQNQNQADETRKELDKLRATNQDLNQLNDSLSNEVQKLQLQISSQMEAFTLELEENSKSIQELQKKKFALETQVLALQKEIGTMKANWEAEAMQLHQLQAERAELLSRMSKSKPVDDSIEKQKRELRVVIEKILNAEETTEACLTCLSCMQVLEDAHTLVPCGHTFCAKCIVPNKEQCQECRAPLTATPFRNPLIDQIIGKHVYKRQAFETLKTAVLGKS